MTVVKRLDCFTIYLPRTQENKINGEHPQIQVDARGLTTYTLAALERLAKRTHKRLDKEQEKARQEYYEDYEA